MLDTINRLVIGFRYGVGRNRYARYGSNSALSEGQITGKKGYKNMFYKSYKNADINIEETNNYLTFKIQLKNKKELISNEFDTIEIVYVKKNKKRPDCWSNAFTIWKTPLKKIME